MNESQDDKNRLLKSKKESRYINYFLDLANCIANPDLWGNNSYLINKKVRVEIVISESNLLNVLNLEYRAMFITFIDTKFIKCENLFHKVCLWAIL